VLTDTPGTTILSDETAMRAYAASLATRLPHGALLLLDGPLGAGKTTLTAALVAALDGPDRASSPTYTLIHEYPTPNGDVIHVDAYRLESDEALDALALDEYLDRARLVVIEWGGRLADRHPEAWHLTLSRPHGPTGERHATLQAPRANDATSP